MDTSLPIVNRKCMIEITDLVSKNEAIARMVDLFEQEGYLFDGDEFNRDVLAREDVFSTYIGFGIGLPHGKSDAVKNAGICVAKLSDELVWNAETGDKIGLIIMIAVKKQSDGDLHLQILSKLSRMLMHEDFRNSLKNSNLDELYTLLIEKLEV